MSRSLRGCFKYSCIGCLVVAGVGLVSVLIVAVLVGRAATREAQMEPIDSVHGPPAPAPTTAGEGSLLPTPLGPLDDADPRLAEPGRIQLDVSLCSFTLEAGEPGEALRLEGSYDASDLEVSEDWESSGEVGWTYRLKLRQRGLPFSFNDDGEDCRMRLAVPRDTPFVLEGKLGIGQSRIDLGQLDVLEVDLETGIGDHEINFGEPARRPLRRVRVDGSIGELRVSGVGDASPAEFELHHNLGEVTVDLRGAWRNDATVTASCGMGSCRLILPDEAGIEVVQTSLSFGESNLDELDRRPPQAGLPTLRLSLSAKMGELVIE